MAESSVNVVPIQHKGNEEKQLYTREDMVTAFEKNGDELNDWSVVVLSKKQGARSSEVNKRRESKISSLKAVGVLPGDLAKYGLPFYIHCEKPNCYVQYLSTKFHYGCVATTQSYESTGTRFALEIAACDENDDYYVSDYDSHYIKAISDVDQSTIGYLYISDRLTGFAGIPGLERHRKIMWSHNKEDKPNYKFMFYRSSRELNSYHIVCKHKYLSPTTGFKRHLKASDDLGYFEFNLPNSEHMVVHAPGKEWANRSKASKDKHYFRGHDTYPNSSDEPYHVNLGQSETYLRMLSLLRDNGFHVTNSIGSLLVVPPNKDVQVHYTTNLIDAKFDIKLFITIKDEDGEKELKGWKTIYTGAGTVIQKIFVRDHGEDFGRFIYIDGY